MSNIKKAFENGKAFIAFITCGDPDPETTAKVVRAMAENFGAKPENIRAAIGPNIGMCHFETDHDVPDAMRAAFGPEVDAYIEKRGEKYHLDLKQINAMVLRRCGVEHIDLSRDCTVCSCDRFWSHRATGGERGSQGAVIVCQEVTLVAVLPAKPGSVLVTTRSAKLGTSTPNTLPL